MSLAWTQTPVARLAVAVLGLVALVALLHGVDMPRMVQAFRAVPLWVWPVSVLGMVLSHALRGGRMRAEWRQRLHMDWTTAWALVVRHSAWVVLAPMRGGEGVYLWALKNQGDVPIKESALSLLKLRLQDMAVLGVLGVAAFAPLSWGGRLALAVLSLLLAMWGLPLAWRWLLARARAQSAAPLRVPAAATLESWFYALSNWLVKLAAIGLPLWALNDAGWHAAWCGALGGEVAAAMPFQPPAGIGPYEAGVWAGMRTVVDLPVADVAAAALTVHVLMLLTTVASATVARILGWSARDYRRSKTLDNSAP